jgi:hypothetical protein
MDEEPTTEVSLEDIPDAPAWYITIRHTDEGEIELDIGDLPFESALGLLTMALAEMTEAIPPVLLRSTRAIFYCEECAEDEGE